MKATSFLSVIILLANLLFAQESSSKIFSSFETGLYGGLNFSTLSSSGPSFIIEGKTNLSANLNAKLSIGYSKLYLPDSYPVRTYWQNSNQKYQTISYDVTKTEYSIIPITLGIEYILNHDTFSPYCLFELGYNSYTTTIHSSAWSVVNYDSYAQIPSEYKTQQNNPSEDNSYKLDLGFGLKYKLSRPISIDVRYLYQFNKVLNNANQILVGFVYSY
jgi:hypothetical protein